MGQRAARTNKGPTLIEFFTYRAEGIRRPTTRPATARRRAEHGRWATRSRLAGAPDRPGRMGRGAPPSSTADTDVRAAQKEAEKLGILPQQGKNNIPSMFEDVYADDPGTSPSSATRRWTRRADADHEQIQAINDAHKVMMRRDPGHRRLWRGRRLFGGVFRATAGLQKGSARPAASMRRSARAGSSARRSAWPPMASSPSSRSSSPTISIRATTRSSAKSPRSAIAAGEWTMPMVIRTPYGGGIFGGQTHSQSPEACSPIAGLKVVIPSTPYDAKGLLIAAIEDPPVIFFEPKRIYNGPFDGHHDRPVTPGPSMRRARCRTAIIRAARQGEGRARGRGADRPRLWHDGPCRAGRGRGKWLDAECRPAHPGPARHRDDRASGEDRPLPGRPGSAATSGFGAELATLVQERCFYHLEAPVERVTGWDTPYPHAYEWVYFPGPIRLKTA